MNGPGTTVTAVRVRGGAQYFGKGAPFGYFTASAGGWQLDGEPYTVADGNQFMWFRSRVVGGRTNHYARNSYRISAIDMKARDIDGLGDNWPLGYDELAPYYDKVEEFIGVTGTREGIASAPDGVFHEPPRIKAHEILVQQAGKELGIPFVPNRRSVITKSINGRPACHYCGHCSWGCTTNSNYSSSLVEIFPAMKTGKLTLVTDAMAREVTTNGNGRATGVLYIDKKTRTVRHIKARAVVLAASACESARILLNSKSREFPNGLANGSSMVGRNLMDTVGFGLSGHIPAFEGMPPVRFRWIRRPPHLCSLVALGRPCEAGFPSRLSHRDGRWLLHARDWLFQECWRGSGIRETVEATSP